jgi:hypothetical protein
MLHSAAGRSKLRRDQQGAQASRRPNCSTWPKGWAYGSPKFPKAETAGVKEGIAADVLGHEKQTLSYGLCSSGSSLKQKLEAVSKVVYPGTLAAP